MAVQVGKYTFKNHWIVYSNCMNYMVYKLYPNKAVTYIHTTHMSSGQRGWGSDKERCTFREGDQGTPQVKDNSLTKN